MPITSTSLVKLANREDVGAGIKRWRVDGLDARGRRWVRGPFFAIEAEAEAIRSTVVWNLSEADFAELLVWVQSRQSVADFDFTNRDINEDEGEEFIFQTFAESPGDEAIKLAWWMDDINTGKFNQIRDRLGYTGTQGADITSRFTFMVSVEPWYDFIVEAP